MLHNCSTLTGFPLDGLFLEAPFNNIIEAATVHPFSQVSPSSLINPEFCINFWFYYQPVRKNIYNIAFCKYKFLNKDTKSSKFTDN